MVSSNPRMQVQWRLDWLSTRPNRQTARTSLTIIDNPPREARSPAHLPRHENSRFVPLGLPSFYTGVIHTEHPDESSCSSDVLNEPVRRVVSKNHHQADCLRLYRVWQGLFIFPTTRILPLTLSLSKGRPLVVRQAHHERGFLKFPRMKRPCCVWFLLSSCPPKSSII